VNFPLEEQLEELQSPQPEDSPLFDMSEIRRLVSTEPQRGQGGFGAETLTRSSKTSRHLLHWYLKRGMACSYLLSPIDMTAPVTAPTPVAR
jgi:hypothetical protein